MRTKGRISYPVFFLSFDCQAVTPDSRCSIKQDSSSRRLKCLWLQVYCITTFPTFPTFFILFLFFSDKRLLCAILDNLDFLHIRFLQQFFPMSYYLCKTFGISHRTCPSSIASIHFSTFLTFSFFFDKVSFRRLYFS